MTKFVKLIPIGDSTGVIIPKDVLTRLRVDRGDTLSLVEGPGGIQLGLEDPEFDAQIAIARDVMKRRRKALRELAK